MHMSSAPEDAQQLSLLREIRNRHHQHLVTKGIAERILDAEVEANYSSRLVNQPVTEATLFFASRRKIGNMAIGRLWGGAHTISGSCSALSDNPYEFFAFVGETPSTDLVIMSRLDGRPNGGFSTNFANVGLHVPEEDAVKLEIDELIPLDGIELGDLAEVSGMVDELERLRVSGELSCLSEEGLINNTLPSNSPFPLP